MQVTVHLSKALRRKLSKASVTVSLPERSSVDDLLVVLCDQFGLAEFSRVRLTCRGAGLKGDNLFDEGDEVVLDANELPSLDGKGNPSTFFDLRTTAHVERKSRRLKDKEEAEYQRLWDRRREEAGRSTGSRPNADGTYSTALRPAAVRLADGGALVGDGPLMNRAPGRREDEKSDEAFNPSMWRVAVAGRDEVAQDADVLRHWIANGFVRSDTQVFNPDKGTWMCLRAVPQLADLFRPSETLIQQYREDYSQALLVIDRQVGDLIQQGKEMQALTLLDESVATVVKLNDALRAYYEVILDNLPVLRRFGSERLRQLGHDPLPTRAFLKQAGAEDELVRGMVLSGLKQRGYSRSHWLLDSVLLAETEYMLDALEILVEPEFVPLAREPEGETVDRYIPPSVKIAVWRRDEGRCSVCKSREKLEYDHIIPVSKGGSNTERNVQLLCEACNRRKSAAIE